MSKNHKENIDRLVDLAIKCIKYSDETTEQTGKINTTSSPHNGSNSSYVPLTPIPLYIPNSKVSKG